MSDETRVDPQDPEYRQKSIMFNDISRAPVSQRLWFSQRHSLAEFLHSQGWRREEKESDINYPKSYKKD